MTTKDKYPKKSKTKRPSRKKMLNFYSLPGTGKPYKTGCYPRTKKGNR